MREDAAAGELDNEHLEEGYNPLCVVPLRTSCPSQSACKRERVRGNTHALKLSIAGLLHLETFLRVIRKTFDVQTNTNAPLVMLKESNLSSSSL